MHPIFIIFWVGLAVWAGFELIPYLIPDFKRPNKGEIFDGKYWVPIVDQD